MDFPSYILCSLALLKLTELCIILLGSAVFQTLAIKILV